LTWLLLGLALISTALVLPSAAGATYSVSPGGEDGNNGTVDSPWSLAKANGLVQPGDTVVLLDGVYRGTPIAPARSGKEGNPITYRAANAGKAVLIPAPVRDRQLPWIESQIVDPFLPRPYYHPSTEAGD
jgi:hypothetical protein